MYSEKQWFRIRGEDNQHKEIVSKRLVHGCYIMSMRLLFANVVSGIDSKYFCTKWHIELHLTYSECSCTVKSWSSDHTFMQPALSWWQVSKHWYSSEVRKESGHANADLCSCYHVFTHQCRRMLYDDESDRPCDENDCRFPMSCWRLFSHTRLVTHNWIIPCMPLIFVMPSVMGESQIFCENEDVYRFSVKKWR